MWKSNVKNNFCIISHVGLSEWRGTQIIAQSLKTHQQNGPKTRNTSSGNKYMFDY